MITFDDARRRLSYEFPEWTRQVCACGHLRAEHGDVELGGSVLIGHGPCQHCCCPGFHVDPFGRQPAELAPADSPDQGREVRRPERSAQNPTSTKDGHSPMRHAAGASAAWHERS